MAGIVGGGPKKQVVRLASPTAHYPVRCEFRLGRILGYDAHGAQVVDLLPGPALRPAALLAQADGLALIPAEVEAVAAGMLVKFLSDWRALSQARSTTIPKFDKDQRLATETWQNGPRTWGQPNAQPFITWVASSGAR